MSLRYIDSFDTYATADIQARWGQGGSNVANLVIQSGAGRRGTNCLRVPGSFTGNMVSKAFDQQATWVIGFAMKVGTLPTASAQFTCGFFDGSNTQVDWRITNTGALAVYRGGTTLLATSVATISAGVWYYLEFKATIHNSTGSYELRLDGVNILSATGQNLRHTSSTNNSANRAGFGSSGSTNVMNLDFDDCYILDGSGSTNNDFLGDQRVDAVQPNGDGSYSQFTPSTGSAHAALVDEDAPNADTDYLSDATSGHRDAWAFENLTALTSPSIKGVQATLWAKKDDAGSLSFKPLIKSGATTTAGSASAAPSSYAPHYTLYETDPNTSAAWTEAGVNAAEFGLEIA